MAIFNSYIKSPEGTLKFEYASGARADEATRHRGAGTAERLQAIYINIPDGMGFQIVFNPPKQWFSPWFSMFFPNLSILFSLYIYIYILDVRKTHCDRNTSKNRQNIPKLFSKLF